MGFAMYCTPHNTVVELWDTTSVPERIAHKNLSMSVQEQLGRFAKERDTWGRFASPRDVAASMLGELPEMTTLIVQVGVRSLGRDGRVGHRWVTYVYDRGDAAIIAELPGSGAQELRGIPDHPN